MRVTYSGKSVSLSNEDSEYVEKKLQHLARYFSSAREAHLSHKVQRNVQTVEVLLDLDGRLLRAEGHHNDLHAAVDQVVNRLEHQLTRYKSKLRSHKGRADAPTVATILADTDTDAGADGGGNASAEDEPQASVVRRKTVSVQAMSTDEASLQMELLHHDFFLFQEADSGQLSVLYRRRDGNYGLLSVEG